MKFNRKYGTIIASALLAVFAAAPACAAAGSPAPQQPVARAPISTSPAFQVTTLAVNPPEVDAGVQALITAKVANTGSTDDAYVGEVRVEDGKSLPTFLYTPQITIPAGDIKLLSVILTQTQPGNYRVRWGKLSGNLVVNPVQLRAAGAPIANVAVNATAPDFTSVDIVTGKSISLSQYKGSLVLLNFVNYGCDPSLNNIVDKQFQAIKQLTGQRKDFTPISVFCGCCPPEVLRQFTQQNGFNWPWILDTDYSVITKYTSYVRRFGYPTLIYIDKDQNIRLVNGYDDLAALNKKLDQIASGGA